MPTTANARFWIGLAVTSALTVISTVLLVAYVMGTTTKTVEEAVRRLDSQDTALRTLVTQQAVAQTERTAQSASLLNLNTRVNRHDDALANLATMQTDMAWLKSYLLNRSKETKEEYGP